MSSISTGISLLNSCIEHAEVQVRSISDMFADPYVVMRLEVTIPEQQWKQHRWRTR